MRKLTRLTLGRGLQRGTLIGFALVAGFGCSDDEGSGAVPTEVDAGVDSGVSETNSTGGNGSTSSEAVTMTSDTDNGHLTVDVTTEGSATTADSTALATLDSTALTSAGDADGGLTSGIDTSAPTDGTVVDTSTGAVDTTGAVVPDDAIDPPEDMIVIQNFDDVAGFPDDADNVAVDRYYGYSMMSLDISFTTSGQRAGVNFNYPGGTGVLCGYDFVARIRMTSGSIDSAGLQMRVWSDAWGQFSSQISALPTVGTGEWREYKLTWQQAVANEDMTNGLLDINAINAVGLEFMSFGASNTLHFDVDWIGLMPSDTPCPTAGPSDAGTDAATTDVTDVTMTTDVDGSVVDTSAPNDTSMPATSESPVDVDASVSSGATSATMPSDAGTF